MTMNVILGSGTMPTKEINATLTDLWRKDTKADEPHWYLIHARPEPTETDKAIVAWLHKNEIWYDIISDGDYDEKLYTEAQNTHTAKRLAPKVVSLMKGVKEGSEEDEPEETSLLALFTDLDNFAAEEDRWLNDVGTAVQTAGFQVLALNDGLIEIDMLDNGEEAEEAEEAEAEAAEPVDGKFTREELLDMERADVLKIAADLGITLPPKTRIATYIKAILGEDKEPSEVEVTPVEPVEVEGDTMTGELEITEVPYLVAPAMLIIIHDGMVVSRPITPEEAYELLPFAEQ